MAVKPSLNSVLDAIEQSPSWRTFVLLPLVTWIVWALLVEFRSPLSQYPGPFLAKYTNLWRLYQTYLGDMSRVYQRLHDQYGPIVRVGPNVVDINMIELVKPVYQDIKGEWKKTEYYHASSALVNGKIVYNLFSVTDPKQHSKEKKPVAKYYSALGVSTLEPHMDAMLVKLCEELETRKTLNLGEWMLFYAWDVIGSTTFSQPIGYLEHGHDFDGTLSNADKAVDYFSMVGMIPVLDYWLDKNPIMHIGPPGFNTVAALSVKHLTDRYQGNDKSYHDPAKPDFLDRFIEAKAADPEVDDSQIVSWLLINLIAGADTTALTLRSAFYYCLRHESVIERLRRDAAAAGISTADKTVSFKDARAIPYVEAVVRESLRILPGVSMPMERYVPADYQLPNGAVLPKGSILGVNPYILCRDKAVYGEDVEEFRPERWLRDEEGGETEEGFRERLARMNAADLTFGGGRRVCIGKELGLYSVYKVLVTLLVKYDFELVEPEKEWRVINSWFPRQVGGLDVKVRRRS